MFIHSMEISGKTISFGKGLNVFTDLEGSLKEEVRHRLQERMKEAKQSTNTGKNGREVEADPIDAAYAAGRRRGGVRSRGELKPTHAKSWNPFMVGGFVLILIALIVYRAGQISRTAVIPAIIVFVAMIAFGVWQEMKKQRKEEHALPENNNRLPVISEETFSGYTEEQLKERLREMADWDCQVFLLSCHQREVRALQELGVKFTWVDL